MARRKQCQHIICICFTLFYLKFPFTPYLPIKAGKKSPISTATRYSNEKSWISCASWSAPNRIPLIRTHLLRLRINPFIAGGSEVLPAMENRFSGIPAIIEEMKKAGLPPTVFESRRGVFKVTLYNRQIPPSEKASPDRGRKTEADNTGCPKKQASEIRCGFSGGVTGLYTPPAPAASPFYPYPLRIRSGSRPSPAPCGRG